MTNPDCEELVKLADRADEAATGHDQSGHVSSVSEVLRECATALRRLASSDGGVKGESVGWQFLCADGVWRHCFPPTDYDLKHKQRKFRQLYTAPPADAGMREAVRRLEELDCLYVNGERYPFGGIVGDPETATRRETIKECIAALTAPGATTKSDGSVEGHALGVAAAPTETRTATQALSRPSLRDDPSTAAKGDDAEAGIKPGSSDPSSTRSEVTASFEGDAVERVARTICQSGKFETGQGTCAVICMDQLGDVRKKGCGHCTRVHGAMARAIIAAGLVPDAAAVRVAHIKVLRGLEPKMADVVNWKGPEKTKGEHMFHMMSIIENSTDMPIDKIARWTGFIQGVLAARGLLDVDAERDRTRPIFAAAIRSNQPKP